MAEVDFSNAIFTPYNNNPVAFSSIGLGNYVADANGVSLVSTVAKNQLSLDVNEYMCVYDGTFNASGTEFYIGATNANTCWRVSNISFNSGDTFSFQIKSNLVLH